MFNLKKSQITPTEKQIAKDNVGPEADDGQPIAEKVLPHREGDKDTITEEQLNATKEADSDAQIIEKVLNEAKSYVTHRSDDAEISVPPINAVVEKMRLDRIETDWKPRKESHWSQTINEKKQQQTLPKWPKNAPQHDNIVLNNDPRRFSGDEPTALVGDITTADIDRVVNAVKTGETVEYDTAIVAILREAELEKRELTSVEQRTISDLKIARTKALIKNA
jgi:hypothetical protein